MRIRRLKLSGFKSFVEPAELHVEPGLTGVVGPNGCGKSNLLEAIRWVMGESSARSMRGGGMEDVIFAGTARRPARAFAEVTLLIDAAPPGEPDLREMEVVRRIERGAGSAYRIDGRDVRAKDVGLLFADAATGAHSPALVSQGRIAAVIAAKPHERRMMLEEAAGIAGLHVRRKDAEQKLRATEANLGRLDDLLGEMEARAAGLRRQARAAAKYRALSDAIRLAEGRLLFARWREAAALADAAGAEAARATQAVEAAAGAQRAAAEARHRATADLARCRAAAEAAREAAAGARRVLDGLRGERRGLERRIAELAAQAATLAADRAREDSLAHDAAAALARLGEEDRTLAARIAGAGGEREEVAAQVQAAESAARDAEVDLARAQATQAAEQADLRVAQAALAAARAALDRVEAERRRAAGEAAALGDPAPLEARRAAAAAALAAAREAGAQGQAALGQAEVMREAEASARDAAQSARATAQAALAALEGEARALARALDGGGGDRALSRITAAAGYERALAAALGDDLDAAVGPAGKRRWAGGGDGEHDPVLPAGVASLADHVHAPPELARRLAQVGVVDTDDGGVPLAPGQRLVTRDGRVRRWDGFVAEDVGAAAAERLVRVNRLAALDAQLPPAREAVAAAAEAFAAAGGAFDRAQAAIGAARAAIAQAEGAARRAAQEEDAAAVALDRLAVRREAVAERVARLDVDHADAAAQADRARAAAAALPDGAETRARTQALIAINADRRAALEAARMRAATLAQTIESDRRRQETARAEAKGWRARSGDAARRVTEMTTRADAIAREQARIADRPAMLDARIAESAARDGSLAAAATDARLAERQAEAAAETAAQAQAGADEALATAREARAGATARQESHEARRIEASRASGERFQCPAVLLPEKLGFTGDAIAPAPEEGAQLDRLSADRERLGPVNLVAESELAELEAERATSVAEREELGEAIARLRGSIGSLNREGRARLRAAFEAVDAHFRRLFTTLFAGGEAHLALVDSDDPLEAGLEIMAQPPGKKLATLTLLSGGEQALTAVALVFALFLTNPAPICVLDEVDAPLDDANVERLCDLLDRMVADTATRYLIVTHNAVTMSRMHRLFGVTMAEHGVSRLVSVDLGAAERLLATEQAPPLRAGP